ncbi:MAG: hypothetical protein M0R06_01960 [Sphaerochaeta sp.]|jgi:hypothetical protein|nr:hypothetical protein [Sphaerochaeta sp.]
MTWCLLPKYRDEFVKLLKSGKISPEKLNAMSSSERTKFFSDNFGGEANGSQMNRQLEVKYLNKNVEKGMVRWAEKLIGVPKEFKNDLTSRIRKSSAEGGLLDPKSREVWLDELIEYRTGKRISPAEAQNITEMSAKLAEAESGWNAKEGKWANEQKQARYGEGLAAFQKYVDSLESATKAREFWTFMSESDLLGKSGGLMKDIGNLAMKIGDISRVIKTGPDNSFFGRQFRKSWRPGTAGIAMKNYGKSWSDIYDTVKGGKEKGEMILDSVKADVWSRPNSMNGRYTSSKGKLDIGLGEEAYPETFVEKIPGLGRLYSASRVSAEGGAMRMRADIADMMYSLAEKNGIDLTDPVQTGAINDVVNSMTGRGKLKMSEETSKAVNALMFSSKHVKSTLDTFLQPFTAKTAFARKQALWNTLSIAASTGLLMELSNAIIPNSAEDDPTSSDWGQLKFGNTRYDLTGGSRAWVTFASRLATLSKKSSTTGQSVGMGEFGQDSPLDLLADFTANKASPLGQMGLMLISRETRMGAPLTVNEAAKSLFMPIIIETGHDAVKSEGLAAGIAATIADMNGISVNSYVYEDDWNLKSTKEMTAFKKRVGQVKFDLANEKYNAMIQSYLNSTVYKKAPDNDSKRGKKKLLDAYKKKAKEKVM